MRIKRNAKTARGNALKHLLTAAVDVASATFNGEVDPDAGESALAKIEEAVEALTPKRG